MLPSVNNLPSGSRPLFRGTSGAVAAALNTGDRSAIPKELVEAMRDSGLAHLLAISGLHMGLVAATLFFGLRAFLAMSELLALRYPIKKWAAAVALAGAFGYLLLTGATIPTKSAFLMAGLVLLAVLLDRTAISLRLVAWAAAAILLITPESLLSASFQMSFAAVVALVAVYEHGQRLVGRLGRWRLGAENSALSLRGWADHTRRRFGDRHFCALPLRTYCPFQSRGQPSGGP